MTETKPWPLDFDRIAKGDEIHAEQIEAAYGVRRTDPKYHFALLRLRERISEEMLDRGMIVTVKAHGDGLRVLVDEEASSHNPRLFSHGMRLAKNAHRRNMGVDPNQLSEGRLREHERTLIVHGRTLQAAEGARKEALKLTAVERKTPGKLS